MANRKRYYTLTSAGIIVVSLFAHAAKSHITAEPIHACVSSQLGWFPDPTVPLCRGGYQPIDVAPMSDPHQIQMDSDRVSFSSVGDSQLSGHVEVRQTNRIVSAQTATIYRDKHTHQVTEIVLLKDVRYVEPGCLMLAQKAVIHPNDKSGRIEDVFYRFDTHRAGASLPAWGQASRVERFANEDYKLHQVTYTTCSPQNKSWQIEAREIELNQATSMGKARNALLRFADVPVFYTPYLSFPTSKERKSGLLMPLGGYSNVGGFDVALPYYLNLAPNYDATFIPHPYTLRGLMLGGDFRFLTGNSTGIIGGNVLPHDAAFNQFLMQNQEQYPILRDLTADRWSFLVHEDTQFTPNLKLHINYQQVSDDYYLQDFNTNLAFATENQLLRYGDLVYSNDHWRLSGALLSYQTLHPINQSTVDNIYQRLPQFIAQGNYANLPLNATLNLEGQYDYFRWPVYEPLQPQGARYHVQPALSFPQTRPWGYITPMVQWVENNYQLNRGVPAGNLYVNQGESFNRSIPRYSVDAGLTFERTGRFYDTFFTQTLEPRLYYLNVPYQNQSQFPAFDSAYMIFNTDQLFRNNRFSGFDRIGDTNQLVYAATTRWISDLSGREKASLTVGQIRYFSDRKVQLCYSPSGQCEDSPLFLGYLSPTASASPIASKFVYKFSPVWIGNADYVFDVATHATNNGDLNLHYQPAPNRLIALGYNYLVTGNLIVSPGTGLQNRPLHQVTGSYAWPLTERWSSLGVYSYNVSEGYSMLSFLGIQYESCCWAARLLGGQTFKSLTPTTLTPQYNNNVYFQILLKGLGSAANSDPTSTIRSYLPGYTDLFRH